MAMLLETRLGIAPPPRHRAISRSCRGAQDAQIGPSTDGPAQTCVGPIPPLPVGASAGYPGPRREEIKRDEDPGGQDLYPSRARYRAKAPDAGQGGDRRGALRLGRGRPLRPRAGGAIRRAALRPAAGRTRPAAHRGHLAGALPLQLLRRRAGAVRRDQRHRHRPARPEGQGPGRPRLPAPGRAPAGLRAPLRHHLRAGPAGAAGASPAAAGRGLERDPHRDVVIRVGGTQRQRGAHLRAPGVGGHHGRLPGEAARGDRPGRRAGDRLPSPPHRGRGGQLLPAHASRHPGLPGGAHPGRVPRSLRLPAHDDRRPLRHRGGVLQQVGLPALRRAGADPVRPGGRL